MSEYASRQASNYRRQSSDNNDFGNQEYFDWEQYSDLHATLSTKLLPVNKPEGDSQTGIRLKIDGDGDQRKHELEVFLRMINQNTVFVVITHLPTQKNVSLEFKTEVPAEQFHIWHQEVSDGRRPYKLYLNVNARKLEMAGNTEHIPKKMREQYNEIHMNDPGASANAYGYFSPLTLDEVPGDTIFKIRPKIASDHQTLSYHFEYPGLKNAPVLTVPYEGAVTDPKRALIKVRPDEAASQNASGKTNPASTQGTLATFKIPLTVGPFGDQYSVKIIPDNDRPGRGYFWISANIDGTELTWQAPQPMHLPWKAGKKTPYQVITYPQYLAVYFGSKSKSPSGKPHLKIYQQSQSIDEESIGNQTTYKGRSTVLHVHNQADKHYSFPAYFKNNEFQEQSIYKYERAITHRNIKAYAWADASEYIPLLRGQGSVQKDLDLLLVKDEAYLQKTLMASHNSSEQPTQDLYRAYLALRRSLQLLHAYQNTLKQAKKAEDLPPPVLTALKNAQGNAQRYQQETRGYPKFYMFRISDYKFAERFRNQWSQLNYKQEWLTIHSEMLLVAKHVAYADIRTNAKMTDSDRTRAREQTGAQGRLREKLQQMQQELPKDTMKVPVMFYPDQMNVSPLSDNPLDPERKTVKDLKGLPIPLYCYYNENNHTWYALSFVNHKSKKPFKAKYQLSGAEITKFETYPPHQLFEALDQSEHLPKGWLFYELPGQPYQTQPVRCKAGMNPEDYLAWLGITLLAVGAGLATGGVGSASVFFLAAGLSGGLGAAFKLYRKGNNNTLGKTEQVLAWLDIAGALLGALQYKTVLGTVLNRASNSTKNLPILTQLTAFKGNMFYLTLQGADFLVDGAMVIGGGIEMWQQIEEIQSRDISPGQKRAAIALILTSFTLQAGLFMLTAKSRVKGIKAAIEPEWIEMAAKNTKNLPPPPPNSALKQLEALGLDPKSLNNLRFQLNPKALERLVPQLKAVPPEDWKALKQLYPEMDILHALHFYNGHLGKARQYLRKRLNYEAADEQNYYQHLRDYHRLDHGQMAQKNAALDAEGKAVDTQAAGLKKYQDEQLAPTQTQANTNQRLLTEAQNQEKQLGKQLFEAEKETRQLDMEKLKLETTQKYHVQKHQVQPEEMPRQGLSPAILAELEKGIAARHRLQTTRLESQRVQLEDGAMRDGWKIEKLKKNLEDFTKKTSKILADQFQQLQRDKTQKLTYLFNRARKKNNFDKKALDKMQRKVEKHFRRPTRQLAKARRKFNQEVARQQRAIEELKQAKEQKQAEKEVMKGRSNAVDAYYENFARLRAIETQVGQLKGRAQQLKQQLTQVRTTDLPRLTRQQTNLARQLKHHEQEAQRLEQALQKARQQWQHHQAQAQPQRQHYQTTEQRYQRSQQRIRAHRQGLDHRQRQTDVVVWLGQAWRQIKHLKTSPRQGKALWKIAKGFRTLLNQYIKRHSWPAYVTDTEVVWAAEKALEKYAGNEGLIGKTPDLPDTLPKLHQALEQLIKTEGTSLSGELAQWLHQYQQMIATLQTLLKK